jgi:hypothetical protein
MGTTTNYLGRTTRQQPTPRSSTCDAHRDNDAQLDRINVLYHGAFGGKYVPRAVLFDLEPGVIDALRASPLGELFRPRNFVKYTQGRGKQLGQGRPTASGWVRIQLNPTAVCGVAAFVVNSVLQIEARPSVRVCVVPELTRCVHYSLSKAPFQLRNRRCCGALFVTCP